MEPKKLPPLYPGFSTENVKYILSTVSDVEHHGIEFPEIIPEHSPIFNHFPVEAVKKNVPDLVKDKSKCGYVWVDTDPVAILCNRTTIRSCHSLDNMEHRTRTANYNFVYAPPFACIFAGYNHPDTLKPAVSPSRNTSIYANRDTPSPLNMRSHQAAANLFLIWNEDKPYIHINPLYDTCMEYPWKRTIYEYMIRHTNKLGIGFSHGIGENPLFKNYNDKSLIFDHVYSHWFSLPHDNKGNILPFYEDGYLECRKAGEGYQFFLYDVVAYEFPSPLVEREYLIPPVKSEEKEVGFIYIETQENIYDPDF